MRTDKKYFAVFSSILLLFLTGCVQQKWTPMCFGRSTSDGHMFYTPAQARAEIKKANLDDPREVAFLGFVFGRGSTKPNWTEAAKWYRKAADAGNAHAQGRLGLLYAEGKGVKQDPVEAYFWFLAAGMTDCGGMEKYAEKLTPEQLEAINNRLKELGWEKRSGGRVYFDYYDGRN